MMLSPEEAQKQLATWQIEPNEARKRQHTAVKKLPKKLRTTAFALLELDEHGNMIPYSSSVREKDRERVDELQRKKEAAKLLLDDLSPKQRQQIFSAFQPQLTEHMETTWQFFKQLPYQTGHARKSFRAPNNPEHFVWRRIRWIQTIIGALEQYNEDIVWLAQYVAYIQYWSLPDAAGVMFAAVIDSDDSLSNQLFDILMASANGEHEVGAMGRHVTRALLTASREEGWDYIERMLLAAQRQEGLRQTILETIDEAHPIAFTRMLHVIVDNNLARFSAVTRAMNVWLGMMWDSESARVINKTLAVTLEMLEDPQARALALKEGEGEQVYMALWAMALRDVDEAIPLAAGLLTDKDVERRFGALHLLATLSLKRASKAMLPALHDDDLRLVAYTCQTFTRTSIPDDDTLFEIIENLLERLPEKARTLQPLIWSWVTIIASRSQAAGLLLHCLGERSPKRFIPHIKTFDPNARRNASHEIAKLGLDDREVRDVIMQLMADRSSWVRNEALRLLSQHAVPGEDAPQLEALLTRKSNTLRRGVLDLLVKQDDHHVLASADRLMASNKHPQRVAGLEVLQLLVTNERVADSCRERAAAYRTAHPETPEAETVLLDVILDQSDVADVTLNDALGLIDPTARVELVEPRVLDVKITSPATVECLKALDALIDAHSPEPLMLETWQGEQEILLSNARHTFPMPDAVLSLEDDAQRLPLRELWTTWWMERPKKLRDNDGFELLRAALDHDRHRMSGMKLRYDIIVDRVLMWLMRLYPVADGADFLLDVIEVTAAKNKDGQNTQAVERTSWPVNDLHFFHYGRIHSTYGHKLDIIRLYRTLADDWTDAHHARLFHLFNWLDSKGKQEQRKFLTLDEVLWAYRAGALTETDLYFRLLGLPDEHSAQGRMFNDLQVLSAKKPHAHFTTYPVLREIFERCRERVLEVELMRGELPTVVSRAAKSLHTVYGIRWFIRILQTLGKTTPVRGYMYYGQDNRATVLSHLLRASFPEQGETAKQFVQAVEETQLRDKQLVEAAVYAPQWAGYVEHALEWTGFSDAVWWIHAHTKGLKWQVDHEIRENWQAQSGERTPLTADDLQNGAVDVQWFWRVYHTLGKQRWEIVYEAAKYSSGGGGHTRAKQFADAMLGQLDRQTLVDRITKKRHQDSVRALGLLPLPDQDTDAEILARYQIMQEFLRTSRKFGSQRQTSEKLAVRIGMENLARTAGYPDPLRLQWAMETEEVADLRDGPVSATVENVIVTLRIDEVGKPHLNIVKNDKKLKAIPSKMRKQPEFVDLRERRKTIEKQHSRMRLSLEDSMNRADTFTVAELRDLLRHPVLAPMLEQVVFINDDVIGYLVNDGRALLHHDGSKHKIRAKATLRIAHTHDLFTMDEWHRWQHECFVSERIQPFKQVFRELYVLTNAEQTDGAISRRYAGHQVQPRQAIALLGSRGWLVRPEEGVQKTFHNHDIAAFVTFLQGFHTPADVEGLTVEGVVFVEPGNWWQPLQLKDVPPVLFSEVMRDLDLVVSVAHRGGVDPETTASTIEMRTSLLRETCTLLKIDNVTLQGNHALVEGELGQYSVHLGSAMIHRQPGGAVCIIPVHAQHRGRIFLPFADDDPKTAEVLSKVLLLAHDTQIKDPTILEQLLVTR